MSSAPPSSYLSRSARLFEKRVFYLLKQHLLPPDDDTQFVSLHVLKMAYKANTFSNIDRIRSILHVDSDYQLFSLFRDSLKKASSHSWLIDLGRIIFSLVNVFKRLDLPPAFAENRRKLDIIVLTSVQDYQLHMLFSESGYDHLITAPNTSGASTANAMAAVIQAWMLKKQEAAPRPKGFAPRVIVVAPTAKKAAYLGNLIAAHAVGTGVVVERMSGDNENFMSDIYRCRKTNPDVFVCYYEPLNVMAMSMKIDLRSVHTLIVDEADNMFSDRFGIGHNKAIEMITKFATPTTMLCGLLCGSRKGKKARLLDYNVVPSVTNLLQKATTADYDVVDERLYKFLGPKTVLSPSFKYVCFFEDRYLCQAVFGPGKVVHVLKVRTINPKEVTCMCVTDDGAFYWAEHESKVIRGFPLNRSNSTHSCGLYKHVSYVTSLLPVPNIPYLYSGSFDGTVKLWDVKSNRSTFEASYNFKHPTDRKGDILSPKHIFYHQKSLLTSWSDYSVIVTPDIDSKKKVKEFNFSSKEIKGICLDQTKSCFAAALDNEVFFCSIKSEKEFRHPGIGKPNGIGCFENFVYVFGEQGGRGAVYFYSLRDEKKAIFDLVFRYEYLHNVIPISVYNCDQTFIAFLADHRMHMFTLRPSKASNIRQNFSVPIENGVNKQVNIELYASYVYLSMAHYFDRDDVALPNVSKWFKKQSDEEREHAEIFMRYQSKRGGRLVFQEIQKPEKDEWGTALEAFQAALELEKFNNKSLLELHDIASAQNDAQMTDFLEGTFLGEQVDSINEIGKIVTNLKRAGPGLGEFIFDKEYFD